MLEAKKFKLGVFVSSGIALLIVALFAHGLADKFKDKFVVYTVFDESVQGLEVGAAVKYKGVTIGRVKDVIIFEEQYIRVNIETIPNRVSKDGHTPVTDAARRAAFNENLLSQIERGLICELSVAGITGMKFIELNHYKESQETLDYVPKDNNMIYIPSKKSLMSQALSGVDEIIQNLGKVDFAGMSKELTSTLTATREVLEDPEVSGALKEAKGLFASSNKLVTTFANSIDEKEIRSLIAEANKTMKNLSELTATAKEELKKVKLSELSDETKATLAKMDKGFSQFTATIAALEKELTTTLQGGQAFMTTMNKTLDSSSGGLEDIKLNVLKSTESLNKTLRQIEAFFKLIEEDPASLIHGKGK